MRSLIFRLRLVRWKFWCKGLTEEQVKAWNESSDSTHIETKEEILQRFKDAGKLFGK